MKESELYRIAEAVIVRDSLTLFMNKLTEQHESDDRRNGTDHGKAEPEIRF